MRDATASTTPCQERSRRRVCNASLLARLAIACVALAAPNPVRAATIIVNDTGDDTSAQNSKWTPRDATANVNAAADTASPTPGGCIGDCNADHHVTVDELVRGVNIALGTEALGDCPQFDTNGDHKVTVDELVKAVNNALNGCPFEPSAAPTPSMTATASSRGGVTRTPTVTPTLSATHTASATLSQIVTHTASVTETATPGQTPAGPIVEFPIPISDPGAITAGPDGNLWFTEPVANKIGRITPTGTITEFPLPATGSFPFGITAGLDGNLWFTEQAARIGRITPAGIITEFQLPTNSGSGGITAGPDGNLWFTENVGQIGRITPGSPNTITEFALPTGSGASRGITAGPDGNLWFTQGSAIGQITPAGTITQFPLPAGSGAVNITAGPDGNLWFTQGSVIGQITPAGTITQFPLPASSGAVSISTGPDGNLWFTDSRSNKIGRITPSGTVTEFSVPTPNAGPQGITAGPDGNLWFTESSGTIGRIAPASPNTVNEFRLPPGGGFPASITNGPDGNLWFTEAAGSIFFGQIGRITPASPNTITHFAIPANAVASGITTGPDGNLWFTESINNKIGRITPTGTVSEFSLPTLNSSPTAITTGPDGNLWFTEGLAPQIGRITPAGTVTEFPFPTASSASGITKGPDGNLWFTEQFGSKIGRITPSGAVTEFATPASSSGPYSITAGPDGNLWFTEPGYPGNASIGLTQVPGHIGRITPAGTITEFPLPTNSYPSGITAGPDGSLWFTEIVGAPSSYVAKIGRITPAGAVTEFPIVPTTSPFGFSPNDITSGPDGNLWFAETIGKIGRLTVANSGTFTHTPPATATLTATSTRTPTNTPSRTPTSTATATLTRSPTPSSTSRAMSSPTHTATPTPSATHGPSATPTRTSPQGPTATPTPTGTAASLTFQQGAVLPAADSPDSVIVADINGDGRPDLITANAGSNNVTVLLGQAGGGFTSAPGSPFAVGVLGSPSHWSSPASVAVADVNGDTRPDLITANAGSNNVTVLLGRAGGGFTPAPGSPFVVGSAPSAIAAFDANGDGRLDLITANHDTSNVTVLLGQTGGGFVPAPGSPFTVGPGPVFVTVADVNGDGRFDLVTANTGNFTVGGLVNYVTILLGQGGGSFASGPSSLLPGINDTRPTSVAVADVNGDGRLDLITSNPSVFSDVNVLLSQTGGSFAPAPGSPFSIDDGSGDPVSVVVTELNGDGRLDLVTANAASNDMTVLLGQAGGDFAPAPGSPFGAGLSPAAVAVSDVNGDGRLDLISANSESNDVTLLLGQAPGGFAPAPGSPFDVGLNPRPFVADVNADGRFDLIAAKPCSNNVLVLLGQAGGDFAAAPGSPFTLGQPRHDCGTTFLSSVALGDVNGDGRSDVIIASSGSNNVSVLLGQSGGGFAPAPGSPFRVGANPRVVAVADVNGDGRLDLITKNVSDVSVLLGQAGGGFVPAPGSPFSGGGGLLVSMAVGDLNGDGRADVMASRGSGSNTQLTILFGQGDGSLVAQPGSPFFTTGPFLLVAADVNGDTRLDLIITDDVSGNVTVLLGEGNAMVPAPGSPLSVSARSVVVADVDADGRPDLAVLRASDVVVLLGHGDGSFVPTPNSPFSFATGTVSAASVGVESLTVTDVNGDRRPDFVVAGNFGVSVLRQVAP